MKIDIFCHVFPEHVLQRCFAAAPNLKDMGKRIKHCTMLFDLDLRFRVMDQFGEYCQVISLASPPLEAFGGPAVICCLPMNNPAAAEVELQRALRDLGARGVQIFTNVGGLPLDRPEFRFLFDVMSSHALPIWLHPARSANFPDYL